MLKICEYCGKPIDYNHAFCDENCEHNTFLYYKQRRKWQSLFSALNIIGIITSMLGLLAGLMGHSLKLGLLITGIGVMIIGILYLLFPYYGIDDQIKKKGIITTKRTVKMLGIIALLVGLICIVSSIIISFL